ncbi:HEPN domain-containing protein [Pseudomonas syringae]|uniref:HEPN domain-containing protein n=1 Tax=Pseudomonas syringae TaxID=317 RepID=UPI001EEAE872|nr:MAE_28990/MAE_18760 family HEPN-like nuclease [Pseudomonas syringae]MCF5263711.1 hypothetical protein [Pseudomonas syringae]
MPSSALQQFDWNLLDVTRLEEAHQGLNPGGQGRRALGHITRSGLVMLCAAWELYIEDLIQEVVGIICENSASPDNLRVDIKKKIVQAIKSEKDELSVLKLSGEGWKVIYKDSARKESEKLNTPKSEQIGLLCKNFIGIENISTNWSIGPDGVNEIITRRGEVAHRGRDAEYITIASLQRFKNRLCYTAIENDNFISTYLKQTLDLRRKPWAARQLHVLNPL